jgi:hypothetical protein
MKTIGPLSILVTAMCCGGCGESQTAAPNPEHVAYKINDHLILRVPPEGPTFHPVSKDPTVLPSQAPQADSFGFVFYLPDFSFKRPAGRPNFPPPEWDHDRVQVWIHRATVIERGLQTYPPAVRIEIEGHLIRAEDYQDIYGLRCWHFLGSDCRDVTGRGEINIHADTPPQPPGKVNPSLRADYMSARYGGVEIFWDTSIDNLPEWHDIDAHVWQVIDAWNVAATADAASHGR